MVGGEYGRGEPIVSIAVLAVGTNLKRAFLNVVDCHRAEGCTIENDPTYPCIFAHKDDERRMLTIRHSDPAGAPWRHFSPWQT